MLLELAKGAGLPCNPHTFRRTFASNLHRSGMDTERKTTGTTKEVNCNRHDFLT